MSVESWKLLLDGELGGPTNMARDEALLASVAAGARGPSFRLYRWRPACLSLGVFQPWAQYAELPSDARPPSVVRRVTGGGAIWHDAEWTYSVVLPRSHALAEPDANRLYAAVHAGLIAGLAQLGVVARLRGACSAEPTASAASTAAAAETAHSGKARCADRDRLFCFDRGDPNDVVADTPSGPRKLIGSAARRLPGAVLQHGSLVLAESVGAPPLDGATSLRAVLSEAAEAADRPEPTLPELTTIAAALLAGLTAELRVSWDRDEPSSAEAAAEAEFEQKHRSVEWLQRR